MNSNFLNRTYPVGSIYISVNKANPNTLFGGTWERFAKGKFIIGVNESDTDFSTVEKSGGSKSINHTHPSGSLYAGINAVGSMTGVMRKQTTKYTCDVRIEAPVTGNAHSATFGAAVMGETGEIKQNSSLLALPPYITCYMWKRTA